MSDLLPCPFCGSPAEFEYTDYNEETGEGDDGMGYAQCTNRECGASFFDNHNSAVKKWNRRASCPLSAVAVEPLGMQHGVPSSNGLYVAYVDPDFSFHFAKKILLTFVGGKWGYPGSDQNYRGTVYGYVGPLPAMRLEDA